MTDIFTANQGLSDVFGQLTGKPTPPAREKQPQAEPAPVDEIVVKEKAEPKQQPKPRKAAAKRITAAAPFSLRLTAEERIYLNDKAGNRPLGRYIRDRLLGDRTEKRRISRKPKVDEQKLALVLAALGQSRLSSNLNQLAKAVNSGTLDLTPEIEQEILKSCAAVIAMRNMVVEALGLKEDTL